MEPHLPKHSLALCVNASTNDQRLQVQGGFSLEATTVVRQGSIAEGNDCRDHGIPDGNVSRGSGGVEKWVSERQACEGKADHHETRGGRGNGKSGINGRVVGQEVVKAMVPVDKIPDYGDIEKDYNGNAVRPYNFLPGIIDNLPDEWYYRTYPYYPYFDEKQRDADGNIYIPEDLTTAVPHNVAKWKECAKMLGNHAFKETGKLEYGYEIGRMVAADRYHCGLKKQQGNGKETCTSAVAMKTLFNRLAPDMIKQNRITELVAMGYKWFYVPCLEANNRWLLDAV